MYFLSIIGRGFLIGSVIYSCLKIILYIYKILDWKNDIDANMKSTEKCIEYLRNRVTALEHSQEKIIKPLNRSNK